MAAQMIFKDVTEIHARLFDHRPVLQGEISYFVKQFEEKRKNREEQRLQKSLEYCRECSEKLICDSVEEMDKHLPKIAGELSTALEMCNMILERENDQEQAEWLKERRAQRVKDWSYFMDQMCEKSSEVDRQYEEGREKAVNYYKDVEDKLLAAPGNVPH